MADLPINIEDLLRQRTVEGDRIEYKAGWNPAAVMRTLCAFANDFENLGGGYIIIGQDCNEDGEPVFPPVGLSEKQLDTVQKELLDFCNQIQPPYFPILSMQKFEGRKLIVLWAPGGQNRPYKVPGNVTSRHKDYHYYIRRYSSTVQVPENSKDMRELISLTATIPFDDRHCPTATLSDLKLPLIRDYLRDVGSSLAEAGNLSLPELCRQLNIVDGAEEFTKPRNVGVLFFSDDPAKFLPGSQIEVVIFPKGPGGGEIIEKSFRGPIHEEVRAALRFIQNEVIREKVIKRKDKAEAMRLFNYPFAAVEEAVVNAVYHRSYEQPEPVEVRVSPDRIEVVSYPGPDVSIRMAALNDGRIVARRYRNRRIGDFLKELDLTEGRCTGIPTMRSAMAENGSPPPRFATDEARTYFFVELLVHPELPGIAKAHVGAHVQVRDEAHVRTNDEAHVQVREKAHVGAHDEAHVQVRDEAHDETHVGTNGEAHVQAHVRTNDEAHVQVRDEAHMEAHVRTNDEAHVQGREKAHVGAHDEAHVQVREKAHVGAHVQVRDEAHVGTNDEAHVQAHDEAHVRTNDEAHVQVRDKAHDEAHLGTNDEAHVQVCDKAHDEAHVGTVWNLNPTERTILKFLENAPQPRLAIALMLGLTSRSGHLYKAIFRLRDIGYIELTEPGSPQSRNQKYRITEQGRASIVRWEL